MPPKMKLITAAGLLLAATAAAAQAQQPRRMLGPNGVPEGYTRVTVSMNVFINGPTDDSEDAQKTRDRARRAIYSQAARECDLLREILAQECVLEQLNNNLSVGPRYQPNQPEGYTASGTLTLSVKLKGE